MNTLLESLSGGLAMSRIEVEGSTLRQVEPPVLVDTSLSVPCKESGGICVKVSASPTVSKRMFASLGRHASGKDLVGHCGMIAVKPVGAMRLPRFATPIKPLVSDKRILVHVRSLGGVSYAPNSSSVASFKGFGDHVKYKQEDIGDCTIVTLPQKEYDYIVSLSEQSIKINNKLMTTLQHQAKGKVKLNLFNPVLDEEELAKCFRGLYIDCGKSMKIPCKSESEKTKFAAFLFYLVKNAVFVGNKFNQTTFFEFVQKNVFIGLNQDVRTFRNYVNSLEFLERAVKNPKAFAKNLDFEYFQHLELKFRDTHFFQCLNRLRNNLSKFL